MENTAFSNGPDSTVNQVGLIKIMFILHQNMMAERYWSLDAKPAYFRLTISQLFEFSVNHIHQAFV